MKNLLRYITVLVVFLVFTIMSSLLATAKGIHSDIENLDNDYFRVSTIILENGKSIDEIGETGSEGTVAGNHTRQ